MILENLVTFVGALLKHIIGVLLLCWRRMLRAGLIAFAIGAVVTVLVEVIGTGEAVPSVLSLIVALLFGLALAYGVALTVLVEELVLGAIDLIRMIEGDVTAGAHIAEVVAEREVGQVGQGLRRLIGLPVSARAPARPGAKLPPLIRTQTPGRAPASPTPQRPQPLRPPSAPPSTQLPAPQPQPAQARPMQAPSPQTPTQPPSTQPPAHLPGSLAASSLLDMGAALAVKAAASAALAAAAQHTTPAAPPAAAAPPSATPDGEPVPADRLPRIEWTYEHEAIRPPAAPSAGDAPTATPEAAAPLAEATTPVAEAAAPVSSSAPEPPASDDMPRTLAELAGVPSADAPVTRSGASAEPSPTEPATALEAPYEDERLAAPASVTTPEGPAEPAERADEAADEAEGAPEAVSVEPVELAPEWSRAPSSASRVVVDALAEPAGVAEPAEVAAGAPEATKPEEAAIDAAQHPQEGAPASRSDSSRRTLPLSDTGATLEGPRTGVASGPRPSAPESGLWERLSSALISRSGVPSGPFASAPPSQPGDELATDDAASQEPEPDHDA